MGFGLGQWGGSEWGLGDALPLLSLTGAYCSTTRTVRVILSTEPMHRSPIVPGDMLNLDTWEVSRLDTGETFTLLQVEQIDAVTWDLRVLEPLASALVTLRVKTSTLLSAAGDVISAPTFQDFPGLQDITQSTTSRAAASRGLALTDLANPPVPTTNALAGGTLRIVGGDYQNVTGTELMRKLVFRRLSTVPGSFFHLPTYGVGLAVKQPLPGGDLGKLKARIIQQILEEPEVDRVQCDLSLNPGLGILTVQLLIRLLGTGQSVPVTYQTPVTVSPF